VTAASAARRRVVLYSGGQERRNALIHDTLLELALRRDRPRVSRRVRMTYMPFTREGALPFYRRFERRYRAFGVNRFECVAADEPSLVADPGARRAAARKLADSDIVYLAGGNTYYFLAHLRRSGLLRELSRFTSRGGVIAGLSAGALILTPHIRLAGYPSFDRDENEVGLSPRQCKGLGVVGFEFFPHYRRSKRYRDALVDYSREHRGPIYACPDGSGIVVEGDRFTAHGDVWQFEAGHVSKIGG
jgi:dipeptidase E